MSTVKELYLPETNCTITKGITRSSLNSMVGETINVVPIIWDNEKRILYVEISPDCILGISEEEVSIYPFYKTNEYPKEIKNIIRNGVLSVKICEREGSIYLSRKRNMLDALQFFNKKMNEIVECCFLGGIQKLLFFELGAGITGTVCINEISNSFIIDAQHYFPESFKRKIVPLKLIGTKIGDDTHFTLSYKQSLTPPDIKKGDLVFGKICSFISPIDHSGLFVEVHPLVSGILDTDYVDVFFDRKEAFSAERHHNAYVLVGSHYFFRVKKVTSKGLKLSLYF